MSKILERLEQKYNPDLVPYLLEGWLLDALMDIMFDDTASEALKEMRLEEAHKAYNYVSKIPVLHDIGGPLLVTALKERLAIIKKATSRAEVNRTYDKISPYYNFNKMVNDNPYAIKSEELMALVLAQSNIKFFPDYFRDRIFLLWEEIFGIPMEDWLERQDGPHADNKEE